MCESSAGVLAARCSSQINGCASRIDMDCKDARAAGETEQGLYALSAWRETSFFTGHLNRAATNPKTPHESAGRETRSRRYLCEGSRSRSVVCGGLRAAGVGQGGAPAAKRGRTTLTNPRAGADLVVGPVGGGVGAPSVT
jgi:AhpD family alkylhydroperoxidase